MTIRNEEPCDVEAIACVTRAAFAEMKFSSQTEPAIIDGLREAGALTLSIVAIEGKQILAHVAFSPVHIDGKPVAGSAWDLCQFAPIGSGRASATR